MRAAHAPRAAALSLSAGLTALLLLAMLSLGVERRALRRGAAMTVELLPLPPIAPAVAPPPPAAPKTTPPKLPPPPVPVAPAPIIDVERAAAKTAVALSTPPTVVPAIATAQPSATASAQTHAGPGSAEDATPATIPPDAAAFSRSNAAPAYPESARRRRQQGIVVISVSVSAQGQVTSLRVRSSSGFPVLDEAALAAVRHWRFAPATRAGAPVAAQGYVELPFVLRRR